MARAVLLALALFAALALPGARAAEPVIVPLAEVGPWRHVVAPVRFGGRIWFANTTRFENNNAADIMSLDPATSMLRFERRLFSQDVGQPLVRDGLLFWPHEDPRWSAGRGEYAVTDGTAWRPGLLPDGLAFHIFAMAGTEGPIWAGTSAWRAGIQRSDDGGRTWRIVHDNETPEGRVSRITGLARAGGRTWAGISARYTTGPTLLVAGPADDWAPVADWIPARATLAPVAWRGEVWALIETAAGRQDRQLARTGGAAGPAIIEADFGGAMPVLLAAGPEALWLATRSDGGNGGLWRSPDGETWTRTTVLPGTRPVALAVLQGEVWLGAAGPDGPGCLWGPPRPRAGVGPAAGATVATGATGATGAAGAAGATGGRLPEQRRTLPADELAAALGALEELGRRDTPADGATLRASGAFGPLALARNPEAGAALDGWLRRDHPTGAVAAFADNRVPAENLAVWFGLWAMAHAGQGRVPPGLLARDGPVGEHRSQKFFHPAAGAAAAIAWRGQDDAETLAALLTRLERRDDPAWLRHDIAGALAALTGRWHGSDAAAWRRALAGEDPAGGGPWPADPGGCGG